jgi:hypothetical protein
MSADGFTSSAASPSVVSGALIWDWRRRARSAILRGMTGRPCNPGSDLRGLWRMLLPGMAFPACGVPENSTEDTSERAALSENARDEKGRRGVANVARIERSEIRDGRRS